MSITDDIRAYCDRRATDAKTRFDSVAGTSDDLEAMRAYNDVAQFVSKRLVSSNDVDVSTLAAENARLRELLEASESWRKAYQKGKYEMYAMGGEILDAAMAHLPCSEGPLERAIRQALGKRVEPIDATLVKRGD